MSYYADNDTSTKHKTNTVIFKLKDDILVVCNNGEPFSIEGIESLMLPHYTSKSKREFKQSFESTIINEQVEELLEKRRENYRREPERIQSDYTAERTTVGEYHEDAEIIKKGIYNEIGYNSSHFGKCFEVLTGETLFHYINERKLFFAGQELKLNLEKSICDISLDLGYSDQSAFTRAMRTYHARYPRQPTCICTARESA